MGKNGQNDGLPKLVRPFIACSGVVVADRLLELRERPQSWEVGKKFMPTARRLAQRFCVFLHLE